MVFNPLYIVWNFNPVLFSVGGLDIRYYGLMWALAILVGAKFFDNFCKRAVSQFHFQADGAAIMQAWQIYHMDEVIQCPTTDHADRHAWNRRQAGQHLA